MTSQCLFAVLVAQKYQQNTFKAFLNLKTVFKRQLKFQTMILKSNHQCEIKQVQGKTVKLHI